MYKCAEKKKLSKAAEDDASNLSASVAATYIEVECNDFPQKNNNNASRHSDK